MFTLIEPWLRDGTIMLALDDTPTRKRGLYETRPVRKPGINGRPRKPGTRLPTPRRC